MNKQARRSQQWNPVNHHSSLPIDPTDPFPDQCVCITALPFTLAKSFHQPVSHLQLLCPTPSTQDPRLVPFTNWEDLPVIESSAASSAAETFIVPLGAQCFDILSNDRSLAALTLGRATLRPSRLAGHAPRIPVLLNVRHPPLKRIAALGTEEMSVMPVFAERYDVFAQDGRLAVFAMRREQLVPVQMAVEPQPLIAILGHRLTGCLFENFARCSATDAVDSRRVEAVWFGADLEGLETCAACVAAEALWVKPL